MLTAYERRIREKRLAIQMKQAKKDKAMFSEKVELARKIERKARKVSSRARAHTINQSILMSLELQK